MAPVILELARFPDLIRLEIVSSGQHREMLAPVLDAFEIETDADLGIMKHGQSLSHLLCKAVAGLDAEVRNKKPDLVIAQGDTSTTFAASLAAFYNRADFAHVEAGLRSHNKFEPFPEEMNRRLTGVIADFHFAPTIGAKKNLLSEGVPEERIWITGNTGIDALLMCSAKCEQSAHGRMILVTAHRRENWGQGIRSISEALRELVSRFADIEFVVSMHSNPEVRAVWNEELSDTPRVVLMEPPAYPEFVGLMKSSYLILTDSGGMQEEAPSLGVPVLVLRNTTERPEGIAAGNAMLVGTETTRIVREVTSLLTDRDRYLRMSQAANPYGDGRAAQRIRTVLFRHYGLHAPEPEVGEWC